MEELGLPFKVVKTGHTDEEYPDGMEGGEIARFLASHKSDAYTGVLEEQQVLLTADTIVWQDGLELGKPGTREEAIAMISSLFGSSLIELKAFKYDSGSGVPNLSRFDPKGSSDSICTIVETSSIVALRNNKYFFVILFFFLVFAIQRLPVSSALNECRVCIAFT